VGFNLKLEHTHFRLPNPIRATQFVKDTGWGANVIRSFLRPPKKNETAVGWVS